MNEGKIDDQISKAIMPKLQFSIKVCIAISYKIFRKGITKYKNVLHEYSFVR